MTTPDAQLPPLRASAETLAEAWIPHAQGDVGRLVRNVALVVGGAALTAVAAQISFIVPWTPVPYTLQTAAVLLTGTALGSTRGIVSMALYVAAGALGLAVFSGGTSGITGEGGGIHYTFGYLAGFVVAAGLVGRLAERQWDRTRTGAILLMLLGTLVIYLIGVPVLAAVTGLSLSESILQGAVVFLPWDLAKVLIAGLAFPAAWRLAGDRTEG